MSNLSSNHDFIPYDAKTTKPHSGQRLARIMYKTDKATGKKPQSYCASIPQLHALTPPQMHALRDVIQEYCLSVQDAICKQRYEEGAISVSDEELSFDAIMEYVAEVQKGARITGEAVKEWFTENLSESLAVAFADKLGISDTPTDADSKKLEQLCAGYRDNFAKLASGKTQFPASKATLMIKALSFASSDDSLAARFRVRLEKMALATDDLMGL